MRDESEGEDEIRGNKKVKRRKQRKQILGRGMGV